MKYRKITLVFLLSFVLILNGCNSDDNSTEVDEVEGKEVANKMEELVVLNLPGGDYGYPNPYQHYPRGPGISKMKMVYDSLLEKGEEELIPWMARDYSVSEDGLEYKFELRDDLYWHDGEKVTPEDVEFSLDYFKEHPTMSNDIDRSDNDYIENIAIDNNNIVIKITDVDWSALEKIGWARIIPKHIWKNVDDPNSFEGEGSIVGSGPYKLEEFNREQGMYKFVAFEDYWATHKAQEVNFIPVSDEVLAFENQDVDLISITPDLLDRYVLI